VSPGLFAGEKAGGGVEVPGIEMRGDLGTQGAGFGVCFEAIEGFGEVQRGVEEGGVGCDFFGGGVEGLNLVDVNFEGAPRDALVPTGFPSSS
jgi:hypothetical protein